MQIKLLKKAQWGGVTRRSGTVHEVDAAIGSKLLERGFAEVYEPSEVTDAPAASE